MRIVSGLSIPQASLREAAEQTVREREDEICHQQRHISDYYRNIKAIFYFGICALRPRNRPSVWFTAPLHALTCVCVWSRCVWVMPAALTADQSVYRSSADQLRPPSVCFQHHGQRHQQEAGGSNQSFSWWYSTKQKPLNIPQKIHYDISCETIFCFKRAHLACNATWAAAAAPGD